MEKERDLTFISVISKVLTLKSKKYGKITINGNGEFIEGDGVRVDINIYKNIYDARKSNKGIKIPESDSSMQDTRFFIEKTIFEKEGGIIYNLKYPRGRLFKKGEISTTSGFMNKIKNLGKSTFNKNTGIMEITGLDVCCLGNNAKLKEIDPKFSKRITKVKSSINIIHVI